MSEFGNFHFLRPAWLLLIPILLLLAHYLKQHQQHSRSLANIIPSEFQQFLLVGTQPKAQTFRWFWYRLLWVITAIALAGPSWRQLPQAVEQSVNGLVIVFDHSPSMFATDLKPNRFTRARHKLNDLLDAREEGFTGLVAYAGTAHAVTPLTDDTQTIITLIDSLSPNIIPIPGNRVDKGIATAIDLFERAQFNTGTILLITDGIHDDQLDAIHQQMRGSDLTLSILGVGTLEGAPIPVQGGQLMRSNDGAIIVPKLTEPLLKTLATQYGGRYARMSLDDSDIDRLLPRNHQHWNNETVTDHRNYDQWQDEAHWLALLLIPFALLMFRRGAIFSLLPFITLPLLFDASSAPTYANQNSRNAPGDLQQNQQEHPSPSQQKWRSFWRTDDQNGQRAFDAGNYSEAADHFEDPYWKGAAHYKSGDHQAAYEQYQKEFQQLQSDATLPPKQRAQQGAALHYNLGNSLAQMHQWEEAIDAYEQALNAQPDFADAVHNRDLIKKIMEREQSQQSQSGGSSSDQQSSNQQPSPNDQQPSNNQQSSNGQQPPQSDPSNGQPPQPPSANQNSGGEPPDPRANPHDRNDEQSSENEPGRKEPSHQERAQQQALQQDQLEQQSAEQKQAQQGQGMQEVPPNPDQEYIDRWLKQLPDTPGNLLKNKFYIQSLEELRARQKQQAEGKATAPEKQW